MIKITLRNKMFKESITAGVILKVIGSRAL